MGLFSSSKGGSGKAAVSKAQRARAVRVQERYEREEKASRRAAKLQRGHDKGAAKGFWSW